MLPKEPPPAKNATPAKCAAPVLQGLATVVADHAERHAVAHADPVPGAAAAVADQPEEAVVAADAEIAVGMALAVVADRRLT